MLKGAFSLLLPPTTQMTAQAQRRRSNPDVQTMTVRNQAMAPLKRQSRRLYIQAGSQGSCRRGGSGSCGGGGGGGAATAVYDDDAIETRMAGSPHGEETRDGDCAGGNGAGGGGGGAGAATAADAHVLDARGRQAS
jgi:hypothetical protein